MKTHLLYTKITIWITILSIWNISAINSAPNQANQTFQADKIVFAVIGDYGESSQAELDVANLVKGWNPDFIVTLGDNNYPNGAPDTIDENIGQYYHEYIFPYRGTYGAGAANKRFFPALGNHDWMTNGAKPYFNYFSFYNEIGYYDFTKGETHFFVLDSDPNEPDGTSSTSEQAKWLRRGLAASSSDFNIVVFHHAPFSSGKHGSTPHMQWPFKAWGADAVISGHDHLYERIVVDGLPYFVNGVGGAELYSFGTTVPGSQIRFNQDYGAMRVEAGNSSMKFQFYTRAGILIDEYTIGKTVPLVTSISRLNSNPANSNTLDFLVTFSEAVTGVDASDFSLFSANIQGASINGFGGSGNTYTVSVNTGTGDGTIRLDLIDNDSIVNSFGNKLGENGAGNGNYIVGETYSLDKSAPSVISITRHSPNPTLAEMVEFLVTFSEPVTGLDQTDISVNSNNGASINTINGSRNIYIVSMNTGSGVDALRLELIDDDSITDQAGNKLGGDGSGNGSYLTGEAYDVDRAAPFVTSIIRAGTNPSNAANVDFIVTFSESVKGVEAVDFALMTTNISDAFVSSINNSDPFYVVTVNSGVGSGTLRLDLVDDDSITDLTGNQLGNLGVGNGTFSNGEAFDIVKPAPIVTSITRANANPSNSLLVDWVVTFSDSVSGVDATDFSLNTSNISGASITNVTGSGSNYTVS
ncbi:MAG TPA: metallophosphoesterase, partial [Anaerolineales bacterium]|nr:metallophosphoesterase [Anaerolineales bacterium]